MRKMLLYPIGATSACSFACDFLNKNGIQMIDHPSPDVTHVLLDIPSFGLDGQLRGGGDLQLILEMLPPDITLIGGNLSKDLVMDYCTIDLLQDPDYLALNAAITADCALKVAAPLLKTTFAESDTIIIGWGRIGKCLSMLLKNIGIHVTIAARKILDRAMIRALGFDALDIVDIPQALPSCKLLFNTVPERILSQEQLNKHPGCIKIELASAPGIECEDVVIARGLPGSYAPISSGRLIAETILKRCKEDLK